MDAYTHARARARAHTHTHIRTFTHSHTQVDWSAFSIKVGVADVPRLPDIVSGITDQQLRAKQAALRRCVCARAPVCVPVCLCVRAHVVVPVACNSQRALTSSEHLLVMKAL